MRYRALSDRFMDGGNLFLGQMKGRSLPVASARFALQLVESLNRYAFEELGVTAVT